MEEQEEVYRTLAREGESRIKIRRSLFLGRVRETCGEDSSREFLREVQAQHRQATHNCWARRLGSDPPFQDSWSDDGEPPGTAGRPLHGAIARHELCQVTVVVSRYFGGQKLGVRGLIDAYRAAAEAALEQAGVVIRRRGLFLSVTCPYPLLGQLQGLLAETGAIVHRAHYREHVTLRLLVPRGQAQLLLQKLEQLGLKATASGEE